MPEGPEVETIRTSLVPLLLGKTLGKARQSQVALRTRVKTSAFAPLVGRRVVDLSRRGKALIVHSDGAAGLVVRLGMTGKLLVCPKREKPAPHTHVRIALSDGDDELRYVDPRRFGEVVPFVDAAHLDALTATAGPNAETLVTDRAAAHLVMTRVRQSSRVLKDLLLDQKLFAGVGNIYASEALFVARLSPARTGDSLTDADSERLLLAVASVLVGAIGRRGTSFNDYVDGLGVPGDNLSHCFVFQREGEPCRVCNTTIEREVQGARSTFVCRRCQT